MNGSIHACMLGTASPIAMYKKHSRLHGFNYQPMLRITGSFQLAWWDVRKLRDSGELTLIVMEFRHAFKGSLFLKTFLPQSAKRRDWHIFVCNCRADIRDVGKQMASMNVSFSEICRKNASPTTEAKLTY